MVVLVLEFLFISEYALFCMDILDNTCFHVRTNNFLKIFVLGLNFMLIRPMIII